MRFGAIDGGSETALFGSSRLARDGVQARSPTLGPGALAR